MQSSACLFRIRSKRSRLQRCSGGTMKIVLTSSGVRNASIHGALVECSAGLLRSRAPLYIPTGVQPCPGDHHTSTGSSTERSATRCAASVGSRGGAGDDRAAQHQRGVLGSRGSGSRRSARLGQESFVSMLLDATIRTSRPIAVTAPNMVYVGTSGGAIVATPDFGGATSTTVIHSPAATKRWVYSFLHVPTPLS